MSKLSILLSFRPSSILQLLPVALLILGPDASAVQDSDFVLVTPRLTSRETQWGGWSCPTCLVSEGLAELPMAPEGSFSLGLGIPAAGGWVDAGEMVSRMSLNQGVLSFGLTVLHTFSFNGGVMITNVNAGNSGVIWVRGDVGTEFSYAVDVTGQISTDPSPGIGRSVAFGGTVFGTAIGTGGAAFSGQGTTSTATLLKDGVLFSRAGTFDFGASAHASKSCIIGCPSANLVRGIVDYMGTISVVPLPPILEVSTPGLNFGEREWRDDSVQTFTVSNVGPLESELEFSLPYLEQPLSYVQNASPYSIPGGGSVLVSVACTPRPAAWGVLNQTVEIGSNGGSQTLDLEVEVLGAVPENVRLIPVRNGDQWFRGCLDLQHLTSDFQCEEGTVFTIVTWDSSSGVLSDLSGGEIYERLRFSPSNCPASTVYCFPPPFCTPGNLRDPGYMSFCSGNERERAALQVLGNSPQWDNKGAAVDRHGTYPVCPPYKEVKVTGEQWYEFVAPWFTGTGSHPDEGGVPIFEHILQRAVTYDSVSATWSYECEVAGEKADRILP